MLIYFKRSINIRKHKFWIGLILILLSINTNIVFGGEIKKIASINIVTPVWKDVTNKDGTGLYIELLDMVYDEVGIKVKYEFVPWTRAVKYIDSKLADAMLGSYNTIDAYFPKYPLDTEHTAVVFKKDTVEKWNGEKTIEERNVVWVRGYNYQKYLNVDVDYYEVSKSEQGWSMLIADRTEFFMNSLVALNRYVNQHHINLAKFQIETVLTKNLYVRFAKTEKSEKLIEVFDTRMKELVESGEIKILFRKWNAIYPNFELDEK